MNVTKRQREAAEESVGWALTDKDVVTALEPDKDTDTGMLEIKLGDLVEMFEAAGGRGPELADEIDRLRIVIAVRTTVDE